MAVRDVMKVLEGLPPGSLVPATWVMEQLADGGAVADLTCEAVAAEFGRTPACVRQWCRAKKLPGAYRLHGREWRIPRAALAALRDAPPRPRPQPAGQAVDLGAWRKDMA